MDERSEVHTAIPPTPPKPAPVLSMMFQIVDIGIFQLRIQSLSVMRKSIHTKDYAELLKLLIETRLRAGLTQVQLGQQLPFGQSGISKIERGERRVDVIELRLICDRLGMDFLDFMQQLEDRLSKGSGRD